MYISKQIAILFVTITLLSSCGKKNSTQTGAQVLPIMSKEEGKVITGREISVWEYSKTKQLDKLREILADDYIGYFATNIMQPTDVVNLLKKTNFVDYHLSNIVVKPIAENVAVIYYNVQQNIVGADGVAWVPAVSASSIYAKRNGTWYSVFYQEMPIK